MPKAKTVAETMKILVREGCADSIRLRYDPGFDLEYGGGAITVEPEHMTSYIVNKLKEIYREISLKKDTGQTDLLGGDFCYSFEELATLKNGGEVKKEWDYETEFSSLEISAADMSDKEKNDKSLIVYSGDGDIAILHFSPKDDVEIEIIAKYGVADSCNRLHPAFQENMSRHEQSLFLKEWLSSLMPQHGVEGNSLYEKFCNIGYKLAGAIKFGTPHHSRCLSHDAFGTLKEGDNSSVFPSQGSGFAATYVPNIGLFGQFFGKPDTHYIIRATPENREALARRLLALRMAKLLQIPVVDSYWHIQDSVEYLVMSRFDVRNGIEIWRGRWWRGLEDLPTVNPLKDRENLKIQKQLDRLICGRKTWGAIDLYEVVPSVYHHTAHDDLEFREYKKNENQLRIAPYIGYTGNQYDLKSLNTLFWAERRKFLDALAAAKWNLAQEYPAVGDILLD